MSIIPAGLAGGYTASDLIRRAYTTKSQLQEIIVLSGKAAEELVLNEAPEHLQTLKGQTRLLSQHSGQVWYEENLGNVIVDTGSNEVFIEKIIHTRNYSEETAALIDKGVRNVDSAMRKQANIDREC